MKKLFTVLLMVVSIFALSGCTETEYTISFNSNGGSDVEDITIKDITDFSFPTNPTKDGFEFTGWFLDEDFETPFKVTDIKEGTITVYAKWTELQSNLDIQLHGLYDLAVEANAFSGTYEEWLESIKGEDGAPGVDGVDGREVEFRVDGGFIQWKYTSTSAWTNLLALEDISSSSNSLYDVYLTIYPDYDKSESEWLNELLTGKLFESPSFTVTYTLEDGTVLHTEEVMLGYLATEPKVQVEEGYKVASWLLDGEYEWLFYGFSVAEDITLVAELEALIYTVQFYVDNQLLEIIEVPYNTDFSNVVKPEPPSFDHKYFAKYSNTDGYMPAHDVTAEAIYIDYIELEIPLSSNDNYGVHLDEYTYHVTSSSNDSVTTYHHTSENDDEVYHELINGGGYSSDLGTDIVSNDTMTFYTQPLYNNGVGTVFYKYHHSDTYLRVNSPYASNNSYQSYGENISVSNNYILSTFDNSNDQISGVSLINLNTGSERIILDTNNQIGPDVDIQQSWTTGTGDSTQTFGEKYFTYVWGDGLQVKSLTDENYARYIESPGDGDELEVLIHKNKIILVDYIELIDKYALKIYDLEDETYVRSLTGRYSKNMVADDDFLYIESEGLIKVYDLNETANVTTHNNYFNFSGELQSLSVGEGILGYLTKSSENYSSLTLRNTTNNNEYFYLPIDTSEYVSSSTMFEMNDQFMILYSKDNDDNLLIQSIRLEAFEDVFNTDTIDFNTTYDLAFFNHENSLISIDKVFEGERITDYFLPEAVGNETNTFVGWNNVPEFMPGENTLIEGMYIESQVNSFLGAWNSNDLFRYSGYGDSFLLGYPSLNSAFEVSIETKDWESLETGIINGDWYLTRFGSDVYENDTYIVVTDTLYDGSGIVFYKNKNVDVDWKTIVLDNDLYSDGNGGFGADIAIKGSYMFITAEYGPDLNTFIYTYNLNTEEIIRTDEIGSTWNSKDIVIQEDYVELQINSSLLFELVTITGEYYAIESNDNGVSILKINDETYSGVIFVPDDVDYIGDVTLVRDKIIVEGRRYIGNTTYYIYTYDDLTTPVHIIENDVHTIYGMQSVVNSNNLYVELNDNINVYRHDTAELINTIEVTGEIQNFDINGDDLIIIKILDDKYIMEYTTLSDTSHRVTVELPSNHDYESFGYRLYLEDDFVVVAAFVDNSGSVDDYIFTYNLDDIKALHTVE